MSKRKKIIIAALISVILLAAVGICVFAVLSPAADKHIAEISLNGEIIRTIDLNTAPDETFTVESELGTNTVSIRGGEISVTDASCPDKICVNHGPLKSELLPIVCLPNKLIISLK